MYEDHFGLTGRPFQLTPDPAFWYETATHRKAMAYLGYGLHQGEGFIIVTGDIGAGKTTLMGHLLATLDAEALHAVRIVSTAIEADDLLRTVATQLGVNTTGLVKADLLAAIERGLHAVARGGRRTLLVVDEVQALPVSALEELRMLSNFQVGGHAMLQIVLLGQPEFRERLHGSDRLEQLRQRVIAIHHLDPMAEEEVADYIAHRLAVVGWNGRPDFAHDAFAALHVVSGGVPRRLNQIANRLLLHAAMEEIELIDAAVVATVAADMHADLPMAAFPAPAPAPAEPAGPTLAEEKLGHAAPELAMPVVEAPSADPVEIAPAAPVELESAAPVEPGPAVPVEPAPVPVAATEPGPADPAPSPPATATPAPDAFAVDSRIAELEARIEAQDVALRRVLTLLVEWVEGDEPRPGIAALHRAAA